MTEEEKSNLEIMEILAKRLDTEPELKDDIIIKPLWEKLVIKTNLVIEKEKLSSTLRQDIGETRGAAKTLLEMIQERVEELDLKDKKSKKGKK